jgi:hypothetical protein
LADKRSLVTPRRVQEMLAVARSHSRFASAVVERFVPLPPPWTAARLEGLGTRPLTIAVLSREFRPHVMMHLMQDTLGSRAARAQLEGRGVRARGGLRWELFALNPLDSKAPIMAKIYAAVTAGGGAAHELLDHSFLEVRRRRFGRFAHSIPRSASATAQSRSIPRTPAPNPNPNPNPRLAEVIQRHAAPVGAARLDPKVCELAVTAARAGRWPRGSTRRAQTCSST